MMSCGWKCGHTDGGIIIIIIMGTIYSITNLLNNKKYIGQTSKKPEDRWKEHIYRGTSNKWYRTSAITKAIHKYGANNFKFEVIEKTDNSLLNEREEYWIKYYNTFYNGYNSTQGGQLNGGYKYDIDSKLLIEQYNKLGSTRKVAKLYNCDKDVIITRLHELNIDTSSYKRGEIVLQNIITKEQYIFPDKKAAARWLINNNYTKTKNVDSVRRMYEGRIYNNKIMVVSIRYSQCQ